MPLGIEVGLGSGDFVSDADPATSEKKGTPTATQFLAHVYCGQTARWMNTPLGTEVDFGQGHIVLDSVPALRERATAASPPPLFGPCLLWSWSPIPVTAELLLNMAAIRLFGFLNTGICNCVWFLSVSVHHCAKFCVD